MELGAGVVDRARARRTAAVAEWLRAGRDDREMEMRAGRRGRARREFSREAAMVRCSGDYVKVRTGCGLCVAGLVAAVELEMGDLELSWWLGSEQKPCLLIWLSGDRNGHGYRCLMINGYEL
ncbi:hypothetical protein M0R45_034114 [Rubus argutus]|uniref:Uncharacterized protein n=1 Tax=Rubus argutus TaxID=59490 RepID=A0AAW1VRM0_RUBAR